MGAAVVGSWVGAAVVGLVVGDCVLADLADVNDDPLPPFPLADDAFFSFRAS